MGKLADTLLRPEVRPQLVKDCAKVIDEEVASKGGISGMAIKTLYKVVKGVKPTIIDESVDGMIDDMVKNLEPFWEEYQKAGNGQPFEQYAASKRSVVADALLKVSDDRAARTSHSTLKGAYDKLRPTGKKNVEEAVPRVSLLVGRYMK